MTTERTIDMMRISPVIGSRRPSSVVTGSPLSVMLARGTKIYVPFLPKADYRETVEACRLLIADGMKPVPHLPARAVGSAAQLRDWLADLAEIGVDTLFLIAGDLKTASGPYENTLAILDSGLLLDHGFRRLGIAGYPEGHPSADQRDLDRALAAKIDYADSTGTEMWMVTQFVFSSDPAIAWLRRMREIGCVQLNN